MLFPPLLERMARIVKVAESGAEIGHFSFSLSNIDSIKEILDRVPDHLKQCP
jgi:hypothetical protein